MTNHGSLAILALTMKRRRKVPSPDEADLRWLIVLETFPADANGWRRAGARLIADEAGLAYSTSREARDRLVAAGVVEYRPGNGRGKRSSYRFAAPLKVPTLERHLAETGEANLDGPNKGADPDSAPFPDKGADLSSAPSDTAKGAETPPGKVPRRTKKGAGHNPLTSENENTALEPSALNTSALSPRAREAVLAVVPDATETEIDAYAAGIEKDHAPGNLGAYIAGFPPKQIAEAIQAMRTEPGAALVSRPAARVADVLGAVRQVDEEATPGEAEAVLEVLRSRGARDPAAVLGAELARGNGWKLLGEARQRLARADATEMDTSTAPVTPELVSVAYPREDGDEPSPAGDGFASFTAALAAMKQKAGIAPVATDSEDHRLRGPAEAVTP